MTDGHVVYFHAAVVGVALAHPFLQGLATAAAAEHRDGEEEQEAALRSFHGDPLPMPVSASMLSALTLMLKNDPSPMFTLLVSGTVLSTALAAPI